ncbi:MAG: hypothetical protein FJ288_11165 [Planctomycetes bacterium]|nr:hypothetical protein [Planctomycetota bacterium]
MTSPEQVFSEIAGDGPCALMLMTRRASGVRGRCAILGDLGPREMGEMLGCGTAYWGEMVRMARETLRSADLAAFEAAFRAGLGAPPPRASGQIVCRDPPRG